MNADEDRNVYQLVVIPRRPGDLWPLTGPYVELVYAGLLGPTATLLARRLGHVVETHGHEAPLSISELGASVSIPTTRVMAGLRRLHHYGLAVFAPDQGLLGVSGFAPPVGPGQLAGLSTSNQLEHRRLTAHPPGAPPPPPPPGGGSPASGPGMVSARRAAVGGLGSGLRRPGRPDRVPVAGRVPGSGAARFPFDTPLQVRILRTCGHPITPSGCPELHSPARPEANPPCV